MSAPDSPDFPFDTTRSLEVPFHLLAAFPRETASGSPPVLLALHGYAMDAKTMLTLSLRFAPPAFLVVSAQGPHSTLLPGADGAAAERKIGFHWGVSPLPEENRATVRKAVAEAIRWAIELGGDPARISLAGFSQPCSFNYRLALDPPHGRPFRAIASICGGIPGEWTASEPGTDASKATSVLHVSAKEDPFYSMERVAPFRERLAARFGGVTHSLYDGGHRIPSTSNGEIRRFLAERG